MVAEESKAQIPPVLMLKCRAGHQGRAGQGRQQVPSPHSEDTRGQESSLPRNREYLSRLSQNTQLYFP